MGWTGRVQFGSRRLHPVLHGIRAEGIPRDCMLGKVPCINGLMQSHHVLPAKPCHATRPSTLAKLHPQSNHPMWYRVYLVPYANGIELRYMIISRGLCDLRTNKNSPAQALCSTCIGLYKREIDNMVGVQLRSHNVIDSARRPWML